MVQLDEQYRSETGQVYTIELLLPVLLAQILGGKAPSIPIEDESMYDKNARGLRATFKRILRRR